MSRRRGILVVQTAFLGDLVLTTPLLRELRRIRPEERIVVVTTPAGGAVLHDVPWVDDVRVYDKRAGLYGLRGLARTIRGLRRSGGFAAGIAAQRSSRSGFLVALGGADRRIGFADAAGSWAYTDRLPFERDRHAVDRLLSLAVPLGGDPARASRHPELFVHGDEADTVDRLLRDAGVPSDRPLACIAPGSHWATKRWLPEGFAAVGRELVARGWGVVLLGTDHERELCAEVLRRIGPGANSLAGRLGVRELVATIARAALLVANDSGPAHVASAVSTPVVSVFGPTTPSLGFTPIGERTRIVEHPDLGCRPCDRHGPPRCPLGHFRCMREIGPDRVLDAVDSVLGHAAPALPATLSGDRDTPRGPRRTRASLAEGRRG